MSNEAMSALDKALRSNRRSIQLLDEELARLSLLDPETADALAELEDDIMPAFAAVLGSDKEPGIILPNDGATFGPQNPFFGLIQLPPDAPFVATSLVAIYESVASGAPELVRFFDEHDLYTSVSPLSLLGFRLFDTSSSTAIVDYQRITGNVNGANGQLAPVNVLTADANGGVSGDWVFPETAFPKSATLRAEAYARAPITSIGGVQQRLHIILCGYKIFGD